MMKKQTGFNLIEMMIVLLITGVITSVAVPTYQNHTLKVSRSEGMTAMLDIMRAQEDYFANNFTYTVDLTELNYLATVITDSTRYAITAEACADLALIVCIQLKATAQNGQQTDGNLILNSLGTRSRDGVSGWTK